MKENNLFLIMIGLLLLTTFIDLYTAMSSPIFHVTEANPLKVYLNNTLVFVTIIMLITLGAIYFLKSQLSLQRIFVVCTFFVYAIGGHLFGVYTNIVSENSFRTVYAYEDNIYPQDSQQFKAVESKNNLVVNEFKKDYEKYYPDKKTVVTSYFSIIGFLVILPMILNWISFYVAFSFYNSRRDKRDLVVKGIYKEARKLQ